MPSERRFVASPHLVAYWDEGSLIVFNYATGTNVVGTRAVGSIVHVCSKPRSLSEIHEWCPELTLSTIRGIVRLLRRHAILYPASHPLPVAEVTMRRFGRWNPEAGFFHTATKNVRFALGLEQTTQPPIKRRRGRSRPRNGGPSLALPLGNDSGEFPEVLLRRRTWRRFGGDRISLVQLATLLRLTLGVHHQLRLNDGSLVWMRTSPSGGAMHPIDAYVLSLRVRGLPAGLYRYDSFRHRVQLSSRGVRRDRVERYLPTQPWYQGAAAVLFLAATFERTRQKYEYSRAYRAVLVEAGHLCQTFCLTATWLGLAPFCSLALADSALEKDLRIDGLSESVLYAAGVGTPHGDAAECMVPIGVAPLRIVANPVFTEREKRPEAQRQR